MILGIDPGNIDSAFTLIEAETCKPVELGKVRNEDLIDWLTVFAHKADYVGIEMVASYGMPVGKEVFDTCVAVGKFSQLIAIYAPTVSVTLIYRLAVKLHHCHDSKAKDPNITRALVDRFTPGSPNYGKGTKADPGWFYGFHKDVWAAYAVTVLLADQVAGR
ncbi:hypothetical protein EFK50_16575 [Nocardioides marmoriginsengisoli]|uniref:Uncharacterized protein n=1 Tax=Nocardioides marmoriginsengisoli TaxID=661483 RepID=A0A3N0CD38_9ACTN|nr:hypothetical protein EFK50_16575 [Nocardioides marmoriginsengisoli]